MDHAPQYSRGIRLYLLGTLVAVELLMSFSFLGYFHAEPISVTIAYIPVLAAGALMGPLESTLLGAVFGLASMWKASASYIMAFDQLFSPLMSGHPVKSILLSVGSRALFGLLTGLLYQIARRTRHPAPWVGVISYLGPFLHSALVYSAMLAFFPETGYTPLDTLRSFLTPGNIVEALVTAGLVLLVWRGAQSRVWTQFLSRVEAARSFRLGDRYHVLSLVAIILLALLSSVAVAIYFVNRMESALALQGISLTDTEYADLLHLQVQFLIGILAMMTLLVIFLLFNRLYSTYMDREARTDPLTGAMNRRAFFQSCAKALRGFIPQGEDTGYFIMVDMDRFKEINDRYGHPEGDQVLQHAALELEDAFGRDGLIGRVGGDEFALLLYTPMSRKELERSLRLFQERLRHSQLDVRPITCSIGAHPITPSRTVDDLYRDADRLLYLAKQKGRNQFVIGPVPEASLAGLQ